VGEVAVIHADSHFTTPGPPPPYATRPDLETPDAVDVPSLLKVPCSHVTAIEPVDCLRANRRTQLTVLRQVGPTSLHTTWCMPDAVDVPSLLRVPFFFFFITLKPRVE